MINVNFKINKYLETSIEQLKAMAEEAYVSQKGSSVLC